ncbi:MAG: S-methyl-5-thioribose-1-phosphate isomerase [Candidatus Marsarchaeota archaeon]|nr:S-methyl-5-thioribose-1-phosphate isomerase [Candidatus Marsarchaeota archaeon]MCL5412984.1 S-methyl-5-thioribose-1-phosphate isomerase [Candidatus Marsarchaeota archaeon]
MTNVSTNVVPIRWDDGKGEIVWLDNSQIPWKEVNVSSKDLERLINAIQKLEIRGAPILGEAGAYGTAMIANNSNDSKDDILKNVTEHGNRLAAARPTAVNLSWGVRCIQDVVKDEIGRGAGPKEIKSATISAAKKIQADNIEATHKMGEQGKHLVHDGDVLVTVCNAGTLACDGLGTSTAPLRAAWADGVKFRVLTTYTAPLYQGARLTAWELHKDGIPVQVITDNMAGHLMREEKATAVWAGADRILGNYTEESGSVYNKIGTFGLSLMARELGIKMYVAAPTSTIDPVHTIADVKIEQRKPEEVETLLGGTTVVPEGVRVINPAFDRTPPSHVSAIVTELGVAEAPYNVSLTRMLELPESMVKVMENTPGRKG